MGRGGGMSSSGLRAMVFAAVMGCAVGAAAQHGGGPPGGGGHGGGPGGGGPPGGGAPGGRGPEGGNFPTQPRPGGPNDRPGQPTAPNHATVQLGPPGRWWDDGRVAKTLRLSTEQQRKMDAVFDQNKGVLVERYKTLQREQQALAPMAGSAQPDEGQLMAQIDRVAVARAELEKANAHMLLAIRKELSAEQVKQLARVE